ncbi:hypothetical protein ACQ9AR_26060 [Streptomyces lividans]|uniref:Uncharacterized protein n=4 Tax=Streptomyces TaxID=1883 RepID=Q9L0T1_STRCO|nr:MULTISPECIES: hypothetical protein [Streptomyces]EOY49502.1 hypothetical protein SLI_4794 [Streptomyces lividans 1326]KKD14718.1 hypothetical protein TR66_14040 [Streptomyces sp. WM6391]MBQ0951103.1 hypothetical protein [Streptomyces sp. RK76]NSL81660.1 hypothetical protein [Streptomyces coelicolor]PSK60946.1 hypothetical protein B0E38_00280 [Streptomyces sp. 111WW2]QFI44456.1 hypothetical protein FQ762_23335 [Streptomyces coelicolor A3(2)]QSJ09644.1 hypothetical protein SLIVDG2_15685 [St
MTTATSENGLASVSEGEAVHVRWIMPEGFFELPMDVESIDELADELISLAQRVMPDAPENMQYQWAALCAGNYDAFVEGGIQYAGFVITEVDGTRCAATVHVSMTELADEARLRPILATAGALRDLGQGEVTEIDLPCGPAVSLIGARRSVVDAALAPSGHDEPFWTSFIQAHVPLPNGTVVVLEMVTPTQEGWDVFSAMFAGILKSLCFFDDKGTPVGLGT